LFGVLAGQLAMRGEQSLRQRVFWLATRGLVLIVAGELLSIWAPINKQLWTPSFAVLMAGLATIGLALAVSLVDGGPRTVRPWFAPLEILGRNAVAAYLVSRVAVNVAQVHVSGKSLHDDLLARIASPPNASLLFAIVVLTIVFVAIWLLHRRHWHLRF
jgi:predicted acyltransferase